MMMKFYEWMEKNYPEVVDPKPQHVKEYHEYANKIMKIKG